MIGFLRGKIEGAGDDFVYINVSGVGYKVFCSRPQDHQGETTLYTYTYLDPRDNALELYGFPSQEEEKMFEILISISGIGPKGALGVLAAAPLEMLQQAIASEDTSVLTKVSGIGRRTAQKIILELKDKFGEEWALLGGDIAGDSDVIDALTGLGYTKSQAQRAVRDLPKDLETTEEKIKEALKRLG